ncbi:diguanylate cyclase domain-containing protein [Aliamphritea spongicola]|nr:diguanylate cyclase [Aliamphritea spongicola]
MIQIKEKPVENVLHYEEDSDALQAKAAQRIHQFLMAEDILARLDNNCFAVIPANPERLDESNFSQCLTQNLQQQPLTLNGRSAYVKCKISRQNVLMHSAKAGADYAFQH